MKLKQVQIRNFRSYVAQTGESSFSVDFGDQLNFLVGANNCGKSNLLRAIALALGDWEDERYDREKDSPAHVTWAYTRITLTFSLPNPTPVEKTLLKYLKAYETSAGAKSTFADDKEIHVRVEYFNERKTTFLVKGRPNKTGTKDNLDKCIAQFRACLRFVYLRSGEGLGEFLKETLHEILETVLKEHLYDSYNKVDAARTGFVSMMQAELLQEMGSHVLGELRSIVQEIGVVGIEPLVPSLKDMLSSAEIRIKDSADTMLLEKGTGIRGVLLVALLRYLCENSRRSMVIAIEEPESFLHPEAQAGVRKALEELAKRSDNTVLVTTHSPQMLSRSAETRITALKKDSEGKTIVEASISGHESHATVVSSLYGGTLLPFILEAIQPIADSQDKVLIVEGQTDKFYLEHAARLSGQPELLQGFEIRAATGAHAAALEALLLRQLTGSVAKIGVLLDSDPPGKEASKLLKDRFKWGGTHACEAVFEYKLVRPPGNDVPVEAEDLYPGALLEKFFKTHGNEFLEEKQRYRDGTFHYGLNQAGKENFVSFVEEAAVAADIVKWVALIQLIRTKFGL